MPLPTVDQDTGEPQTLNEIRDWYRGVADALIHQRATLHATIRAASFNATLFTYMTEREIDESYDQQQRELERLTILNLVASAEATIKLDYVYRVRKRLKDTLGRAYEKYHRSLSVKKQLRLGFEGGILDVLKNAQVMDNHIIGRYRECLRVRHWIGHGRFWLKPVELDLLDPDEVHNRANAIVNELPSAR